MLLDLKQLLSRCGISLRGVIHVGAHHGQELPLYRSLGAREMMLFEPLPANFQRLCEVVRLIQRQPDPPRIDCYPLALGTVHEVKEMTVASNDGQSSSLLKPKEHLKNHPHISFDSSEKVYVTRMDRMVAQPQRYNLLCIDVQGYELEVLKGAGKTILECIEAICCEVNRSEVYEGNAMVGEIDEYLSGHGFERIATVWAGGIWGDALYCRRKLLDQQRLAAQQSFVEHDSLLSEFCSLHAANYALASGQQAIKGINMKDICRFVSTVQSSAAVDLSALSALRLVRMGRFSNNVIQLVHGMILARRLGLSTIILPSNFAHFHAVQLAINGMVFIQEGMSGSDSGLQLMSYCWFPAGALQPLFETITIADVNRLLESLVKPLFFQYLPFHVARLAPADADPQPVTRIALHIRSGDLFVGQSQAVVRPHPFYVQPPLDFYRCSLEHALSLCHGPVRVQLVIEDHKNPVVGAIMEWMRCRSISFQLVNGSFLEAVQLMLSANVIISSYGSVVEMIGMLSNSLHTVYAFQAYGRWAEKDLSGHGRYECLGRPKDLYEIKPDAEYIEPGSWKGTNEQRELMLRFKVSPEALLMRKVAREDDAALPFFCI